MGERLESSQEHVPCPGLEDSLRKRWSCPGCLKPKGASRVGRAWLPSMCFHQSAPSPTSRGCTQVPAMAAVRQLMKGPLRSVGGDAAPASSAGSPGSLTACPLAQLVPVPLLPSAGSSMGLHSMPQEPHEQVPQLSPVCPPGHRYPVYCLSHPTPDRST